MKILVVEDDNAKRVTLACDLSQAGYIVDEARDGKEAIDIVQKNEIDVVIADLKLPGDVNGMELLRSIKNKLSPSTEVIMITGYGNIPLAVEAMRYGATDFISKPFDNNQIIPILKAIEDQKANKCPLNEITKSEESDELERILVGNSPQIRQLRRQIRTWANAECNVLLCGETGTGKDLVASVIHKLSDRHSHPFVKVSCAIFSEQLIESELFGHERGAFTGANQRKIGRFELAEQGTLYLDDVDDIPFKVQVKLLRVIEEKVFERVGSVNSIKCDARIIASTKVNLEEKIAQGTFREDLYYRLKVCETSISPLRERIEDIPLLAAHHIERISGETDSKIPDKVNALLQSYHWPGNVRELGYMLERAYINGEGTLSVNHFSIARDKQYSLDFPKKFKSVMEKTERELLEEAITKSEGNITHAARILGMKRTTFRDKLSKHGLI